MRQYGNALEAMSNEAVEYVRGIPVVKTFGQSVFSFKKFKTTIDEYEKWAVSYTESLRMPMMLYTAAVNGVFAFLIAGGLLFTSCGRRWLSSVLPAAENPHWQTCSAVRQGHPFVLFWPEECRAGNGALEFFGMI